MSPGTAMLRGAAVLRGAAMLRGAAVSSSVAVLLSASLAWAWTSAAPFSARVHGHEFKHVAVSNAGCTVTAKVRFSAPAAQYEDPAKVRNHYRFKARARFASGKRALSPIFFSQKPGDHQFEFNVDTTAEGCWGKGEQKVIGVDVEGCRGRGCTVAPFQD